MDGSSCELQSWCKSLIRRRSSLKLVNSWGIFSFSIDFRRLRHCSPEYKHFNNLIRTIEVKCFPSLSPPAAPSKRFAQKYMIIIKINQIFIKVLPYEKYDQIHNILNIYTMDSYVFQCYHHSKSRVFGFRFVFGNKYCIKSVQK